MIFIVMDIGNEELALVKIVRIQDGKLESKLHACMYKCVYTRHNVQICTLWHHVNR